MDKLADRFAGKLKVGKVNVDENGDLAAMYGVSSIPRLLVFNGSASPVHSITGLRSEADLAQMLTSVVG
jgi:thioredoxin 1